MQEQHPVYPIPIDTDKPALAVESQTSSSLFLQQLLHYHCYYAPPAMLLFVFTEVFRVLFLGSGPVPFKAILCGFIVVLEIFRLPNGIYGNIRESFPETLAFFILTLLSTGLVIAALTTDFALVIPLEFAVLVLQTALEVAELAACLSAMSDLSDAQTALFFWRSPTNSLKLNYRKL